MNLNNYSSSPERGSFSRASIEKQFANGEISQEIYDGWMQVLEQREKAQEKDKTYDLEYHLRSNETMLEKCRTSHVYAQNLYAAMCNNDFFYGDHEESWGCSWRYAGGIVADMRQKGDYIDWYCSGMTGKNMGYVGEGFVTEEIRLDLFKMGWIVKDYKPRLEPGTYQNSW